MRALRHVEGLDALLEPIEKQFEAGRVPPTTGVAHGTLVTDVDEEVVAVGDQLASLLQGPLREREVGRFLGRALLHMLGQGREACSRHEDAVQAVGHA